MKDRARALEFLINSIKGAFAKGFSVQIGDFEYYQLKKGQEVTLGEDVYETMDGGIFQKTPRLQFDKDAGKYVETGHTLLHYGHIEQLEGIVDHLCKNMSLHEIELTMVGITSRSVLMGMVKDRRRQEEESSLAL